MNISESGPVDENTGPIHYTSSPSRTPFSTPVIRVGRIRLWRSPAGTAVSM